MKIDSASINFQASHQSNITRERSETLRTWGGNRRGESGPTVTTNSSRISISQSAQFALAMDSLSRATPTTVPSATSGQTRNDLASAIDAANEAADNDPFLSMIRSMVEMLTGRPVKTFSSADLSPAATSSPAVSRSTERPASSDSATSAAQANFGGEYERHMVHQESESTAFSASGVIRTQDGREIQFNLDLQMERSYREESHISLRYGSAAARRDPLVINFSGNAAQLLDQHFRFDLNNDGQAEELPMLASGSGYLAFDRNGNGRIDNGSELFGPDTDNGFGELADLDADGNGWIDEADPLFSKLGIWQATGEGDNATMELRSLGASGVGALALAHAATPFELRGTGNSNLGGIRSSGIAITEDGKVLSMQEIDLSIR